MTNAVCVLHEAHRFKAMPIRWNFVLKSLVIALGRRNNLLLG